MCSRNAFTSVRSSSQVGRCGYGFCCCSSPRELRRCLRYLPFLRRSASAPRAAGTTLSLAMAYSSAGSLSLRRNAVRDIVVIHREMPPHALRPSMISCCVRRRLSLTGWSGPYVMSAIIHPVGNTDLLWVEMIPISCSSRSISSGVDSRYLPARSFSTLKMGFASQFSRNIYWVLGGVVRFVGV